MKNSLNRILLFLIILALSKPASAQKMGSFLYSEIHSVPDDSLIAVFYSFRIPYNRFVFLKEGTGYSAKFRMTLEITDSLNNHVTRQTEDKLINVDNFDETISKDKYSEGTIKFNVKPGVYHLLPIVTELNSNKDLRLPSREIIATKQELTGMLHPVVVEGEKTECGGKEFYRLANFDNYIPFSEKNYSLIIPSPDTSLKSITVVISKGKDTLFSKTVDDYFDSRLSISECGDDIIINDDSSAGSIGRNFVLSGFSQRLPEGDYVLYISKTGSSKEIKHFPLAVEWFNKPFSLRNPTEAISFLREIENANIVDSLLNAGTKMYEEELFDYWKKIDPTPETAYNPLMNEFYLRIDYAEKEFSTLSKKNGASTDRGKIFIKFGKPQKIERSSNQYGKMVEKWIYEKPHRVFEFVEKDGTGNYTLIKS